MGKNYETILFDFFILHWTDARLQSNGKKLKLPIPYIIVDLSSCLGIIKS